MIRKPIKKASVTHNDNKVKIYPVEVPSTNCQRKYLWWSFWRSGRDKLGKIPGKRGCLGRWVATQRCRWTFQKATSSHEHHQISQCHLDSVVPGGWTQASSLIIPQWCSQGLLHSEPSFLTDTGIKAVVGEGTLKVGTKAARVFWAKAEPEEVESWARTVQEVIFPSQLPYSSILVIEMKIEQDSTLRGKNLQRQFLLCDYVVDFSTVSFCPNPSLRYVLTVCSMISPWRRHKPKVRMRILPENKAK